MVEITAKLIFAKDSHSTMFQQLRQEVNETVKRLEPKRKFLIILKAILFPSLYFFSYAAALLWGNTIYILSTCYFLIGVLLVLNFLNLIHEAMHNTLVKSKTLNSWYVNFFDLMGANSYIWKIRHIWLHHNYPNVMGWDSDFEQSKMLRAFPHGNRSKMHKYQHIYLPFIYPLFIFYWLLIRFQRFFL